MKKLLSLLVFSLVSVASFAQGWAKPEVPEGTAPTDGLECYIMNAESGTFLAGAAVWHSWTTSTGLACDGQHSVLVKNGSNWYITRKSDGKHTFISGVLNADYGQAEGRWEMHVDMGSQGHDLFEIIEGANGAYRIRINANDDQYGSDGMVWPEEMTPEQCQEAWEACFFGWLGAEHQYPSAIYANVRAGEGHIDWKFVTVEAFNEYHEGVATYQAAMNLKKAIDDAEAEYPGIDLSSQKAVYNNTESTLDQLNAAIEGVKTAIQAYINQKMQENASPTEPYDATGLIVNPSFEDGTYNGWTCPKTNPNGFGDAADLGVYNNENATYHCDNTDGNYIFNVWAWGNPLTQTLANVPNGIYRLKAMVTSSDDCTNVYITGKSGNIKLHKAVALETNPTDSRKQTWLTEGEILVPVTNDTLTIGAVGSDADGISYLEGGRWWYKADNFRLEYLGNKVESWNAFKEQYKQNIAVYPATTVAHKQLLADYNQAVADFNTATEPAAIVELIETLNVLSDSIKANVKAYEELAAKVEEINNAIAEVTGQSETFLAWVEYIQNTDASKAAEITTKLNNLIAAYFKGEYVFDTAYTPLVQLNPAAATGCTLTGSEAIAYADKLGKAHNTITLAIKNPGDDCTELIVNASFMKGFEGWTRPLNNGRVGGINEYPNVEVWNDKVEVYQEVPGVPNGLYELNCYAFERPTTGAYFGYGSEPSKVFLYMNDFKTGVMNIAKGAILKDDATPGVNCVGDPATWPAEGATLGTGQESDATWTDLEGNEYWMPNGQCGASVAFHAGRYKQKVYGLVENGTMNIGLTSNDVACGWVLWSNFQLTYWGTDATVAYTVLKGATAEAQAWQDMYADDLYNEVFEELDNAITAGTDATAEMTGEQLLAILKKIYKALDNAKTAYILVNELQEVADQLNTTFEEFAETASPEAAAKAEELLAQAEDYGSLTGEQIKQLIADMKEAIGDLKLVNPSQASDENPMDLTNVIKNNDMEKNADQDWTYTKKEGNGPNLNTGWDGKACEFWAGSGNNLEFNFYQRIKLAEGTYTVSVEAANSLNGQATLENDGRAFLYAGIEYKEHPWASANSIIYVNDEPVVVQEEGCTDKHDTYYVTFKVPAPSAYVVIGVQSVGTMDARWFVCDNFRLTYYGNQSQRTPSTGTEVAEQYLEYAIARYQEAYYQVEATYNEVCDETVNNKKYQDPLFADVLGELKEGADALKVELDFINSEAMELISTGNLPAQLSTLLSRLTGVEKAIHEFESLFYYETRMKTSYFAVAKGWNWMSHSFMLGSVFSNAMTGEGSAATYIASQIEDVTYNPATDEWIGTLDLQDMPAANAYKVYSDEAFDREIESRSVKCEEEGITLYPGWNWIGYLPSMSQGINAALAGFDATANDVLKSIDGTSVLIDGVWTETFAMKPSAGYLYYSAAQGVKTVYYSDSTFVQPYSVACADEVASVFTYDVHQYANNMSVIAKLDTADPQRYIIGAFAGEECRGTSVFAAGYHLITVHGDKNGQQINLFAYDTVSGEMYTINETVGFNGTVAGSVTSPRVLTIGAATGIDSVIADTESDAIYTIQGIRVDRCNVPGIYIKNNKKVYLK